MQWKITTAFCYHHHESRHHGRAINAQPRALMLYADQARSGGLRQQLSCRTNVEAAHRAAPCPQFHGAESSFTGRPLSWNSLERARNSAIKKNPIHCQKNFEFVGEFEALSEMPSL